MLCMQVLSSHFANKSLNQFTESYFVLVMSRTSGMHKVSRSYLNHSFSRMGRCIINLRSWTRTSDLILSSWSNRYIIFLRFIILIKNIHESCQGLPWFSASNVISNISSNLAIGATISHVLLWYGKDIIESIRQHRVSSFSFKVAKKIADWWTDFSTRRVKTPILTWPRWRSEFRASFEIVFSFLLFLRSTQKSPCGGI